MSALTDLFTSMANKIRSKVGGSDTYTPTEMVSAIDDVYDAGVADATTDITPSNVSPASMTSGTGYKPTANGYAISNYASVTPSNASPVRLYNNSIAKLGADGYLISSYITYTPSGDSYIQLTNGNIYKMGGDTYAGSRTMVTPSNSSPASVGTDRLYAMSTAGKVVRSVTNLTPSDSSPAQIATGNIYKPSTGGYAIETSPTSITPSDSSPVSLTSGTIYKTDGAGYAIENYEVKSPDDSSPPQVTYGQIIKIDGAAFGYIYRTRQEETETTLWTNSSPTANFASQAVSLSDDYTNYKRIRFYFRHNTTDDTEQCVEYKKEEIDTWMSQGETGSGYRAIGSLACLNGSYSYCRPIRRGANGATDAFYIYVAYRLNSQANLQTHAIPVKITGIK